MNTSESKEVIDINKSRNKETCSWRMMGVDSRRKIDRALSRQRRL